MSWKTTGHPGIGTVKPSQFVSHETTPKHRVESVSEQPYIFRIEANVYRMFSNLFEWISLEHNEQMKYDRNRVFFLGFLVKNQLKKYKSYPSKVKN